MTDFALIAAVSILTAGLAVAFGAIGPALGEGGPRRQPLPLSLSSRIPRRHCRGPFS